MQPNIDDIDDNDIKDMIGNCDFMYLNEDDIKYISTIFMNIKEIIGDDLIINNFLQYIENELNKQTRHITYLQELFHPNTILNSIELIDKIIKKYNTKKNTKENCKMYIFYYINCIITRNTIIICKNNIEQNNLNIPEIEYNRIIDNAYNNKKFIREEMIRICNLLKESLQFEQIELILQTNISDT